MVANATWSSSGHTARRAFVQRHEQLGDCRRCADTRPEWRDDAGGLGLPNRAGRLACRDDQGRHFGADLRTGLRLYANANTSSPVGMAYGTSEGRAYGSSQLHSQHLDAPGNDVRREHPPSLRQRRLDSHPERLRSDARRPPTRSGSAETPPGVSTSAGESTTSASTTAPSPAARSQATRQRRSRRRLPTASATASASAATPLHRPPLRLRLRRQDRRATSSRRAARTAIPAPRRRPAAASTGVTTSPPRARSSRRPSRELRQRRPFSTTQPRRERPRTSSSSLPPAPRSRSAI